MRDTFSNLIVFNVPSLRNIFYSPVISSARIRIEEKGYTLFINEDTVNDDNIDSFIARMKRVGAKGLVLANPLSVDALERLSHEFHIVTCCETVPSSEFPFVNIDDRGGAYKAVRHLLSIGRRRIAMINGPEEFKYARERRAGYEEALREYGIDVDESYVACVGEDMDYDTAKRHAERRDAHVRGEQEAQEQVGQEFLAVDEAKEHREAHDRQDVRRGCEAVEHERGNGVHKPVDSAGAEVHGAEDEDEPHGSKPEADQPVERHELRALTLERDAGDEARKPVAHQLGQVAHAKNERTDGHSETNGHLGIKAKQAHIGGAQQASRRSIRRNVGTDGNGTHKKRFDASAQDKTGVQIA